VVERCLQGAFYPEIKPNRLVTERPRNSAHRIGVFVHPADGLDRYALRRMLYEDIVCWLQDVEKLKDWGFTRGPNPGIWMDLNDEYDLQYARYHADMALKSMIRHGLLGRYEWAESP